jgi:methionyl-tRNA formyltransferase
MKFIFFGSSQFSIYILDELEKAGFMPTAIVTTPDKPKGRKLVLTPTVVKEWATKRNIKVFDPAKLDADFIEILKKETGEKSVDVYIVASYGKIIPAEIISMPPRQTLNVHPSLLPKYRGASPLQSAILNDDKHTGITIMRIDEKMDHGPIVVQKDITVSEWPPYGEFERMMGHEGGKLLAEVLPQWITGSIQEKEQDHSAATHCSKITKEDGLIDLSADTYTNFRKIQAYSEWPQAFFFIDHAGKQIRIKITSASWVNGSLSIEKVIPEGGKEMPYQDFVRGYQK